MARSKKDIDRELMYKKILPTAVSAENSFDKATQENGGEMAPKNKHLATPGMNQKRPEESLVQPEIEVQTTQSNQSSEIPLPDLAAVNPPTEPLLVNLMEAFVDKRLDAAIKKFQCCTCKKCRKDVFAITLNKLPPLYVIEDDPDSRDLHERERAAQVATALVQAILTVKANPKHDDISR
ncbi:MAG: late competence development ComFB family protein [Candidatus Fimivivens sp.]